MKKIAYATALVGTLAGGLCVRFLDNQLSMFEKQSQKNDHKLVSDTSKTFDQYLVDKFKP